MVFSLTDAVSICDFSRKDIEFVLAKAEEMESMHPKEKSKILEHKIVASLFFEPSTRTKESFSTAIHNLGGKSIGFSGTSGTSIAKGESLHDTIKMFSGYADLIVMRNPIEGSARYASEISKAPIINGGDGANQHPTQTLLDLYTIKKAFGKIDSLNIGLVGDLKYGRTVHSLLYALANFENVNVYCISPEILKMPENIIEDVKGRVNIKETSELEEFLPELDILYATRIQKERFASEFEYERVKNVFILGKEILKNTKPDFKIMHPLPRVNEIKQELDSCKEALYFEQAKNGVPTREALLSILKEVKK